MSSGLKSFLNVALLGCAIIGGIDSKTMKFQAHGKVSLTANTVGPFNNPTETYPVGPLKLFC